MQVLNRYSLDFGVEVTRMSEAHNAIDQWMAANRRESAGQPTIGRKASEFENRSSKTT
jgi:hypothetical protein